MFAALGLAMTAPGQTAGVSVFIDPMLADLGITRSQLSGAYLVGTLPGALTLPAAGRALDRFGVRMLMTTVAVAAEEVRSQVRLHPFDVEVLAAATALLRRYPHLGVRDAVHAATAMHAGVGQVLSADRVFDSLREVSRVDPAQPGSPWLAGR